MFHKIFPKIVNKEKQPNSKNVQLNLENVPKGEYIAL